MRNGSAAANHVRSKKRELFPELIAAVKRAELNAQPLSVLVLSIEAAPEADLTDALSHVVETIEQSIRRHSDWVSTWSTTATTARVAVVLPETDPRQAAAVRRRLREMVHAMQERNPALQFSLGAASLDQIVDRPVMISELLAVAESCRQCVLTAGARHMEAVRSSVSKNVALSCRQGYAVAELCSEVNVAQSPQTIATRSAMLRE